MKSAWANYLEEQFDLPRISQVLIYTDQYQFWLLSGLHDVLKQSNIPVSTQFLDNITNEDALDIHHSFEVLPESALVLGIFSEQNRSIDLLNQVFKPLRSLYNFQGMSIVGLQSFANQYYSDFLETDYQASLSRLDMYQELLTKANNYGLTTKLGSNLEFTISSDLVSFPFHSSLSRNLLFPSTELIAQVDPDTVNGELVIDGTIGTYRTLKSIIDPFGKIYHPITLKIEHGEITDIEGEDRFVDRLHNFLDHWMEEKKKISKIGLGIGPEIALSGMIEVDKMIADTCNLSLGNRELDFLFLSPRFSLL